MSNFLMQKPLILASGSPVRAQLLRSIGLDFKTIPSNCDEDFFKRTHDSDDFLSLAYTLANHKALEVSQNNAEHYVIAADQLCIAGQRLFDKPLSHEVATEHLSLLSGKTHQQIACVCIAKNNQILWQYHDTADLTLQELTRQQIEHYLQAEKPYNSCGAYQYETLGKWLFKEVSGREDTILGLPLLPLIHALIRLGAVVI